MVFIRGLGAFAGGQSWSSSGPTNGAQGRVSPCGEHLFGAQGFHGLNQRGAEGGYDAGQQCDHEQDEADG